MARMARGQLLDDKPAADDRGRALPVLSPAEVHTRYLGIKKKFDEDAANKLSAAGSTPLGTDRSARQERERLKREQQRATDLASQAATQATPPGPKKAGAPKKPPGPKPGAKPPGGPGPPPKKGAGKGPPKARKWNAVSSSLIGTMTLATL